MAFASDPSAAAAGSPPPTGKYIIEKKLGSGTFGGVFLALSPSGARVALKRVRVREGEKSREAAVCRFLSSREDNRFFARMIDNFYTVSHDGPPGMIINNMVFEVFGRSLDKYLFHLKVPDIQLVLFQIFEALDYLHSLGIMHRDLKPANVLLDMDTKRVKLCDMGSSKFIDPAKKSTPYVTTVYYRAPELLFGSTQYDHAVDMYAAGVLACEMFIGRPLISSLRDDADQIVQMHMVLGSPTEEDLRDMQIPESSLRDLQLVPHVDGLDLATYVGATVPPLVVDLVKNLLRYSPRHRYTARQCMEHPFFAPVRQKRAEAAAAASYRGQPSPVPQSPAIWSAAGRTTDSATRRTSTSVGRFSQQQPPTPLHHVSCGQIHAHPATSFHSAGSTAGPAAHHHSQQQPQQQQQQQQQQGPPETPVSVSSLAPVRAQRHRAPTDFGGEAPVQMDTFVESAGPDAPLRTLSTESVGTALSRPRVAPPLQRADVPSPMQSTSGSRHSFATASVARALGASSAEPELRGPPSMLGRR